MNERPIAGTADAPIIDEIPGVWCGALESSQEDGSHGPYQCPGFHHPTHVSTGTEWFDESNHKGH